MWPRQIWGGEICGGICGGILSLQAKGFRWRKKNSARFLPSMTTVQWDPRKITLNLAISKFVSHRNRIPRQFCLHAFFTANFAGDIFRHEFRRQNFSPAPIFRRHRFSPAPFFAGSIFRRAHPSFWAQKHQLGVSASFSKRQAKQPQATSMHPLVTGENSIFFRLS